MATKKDGVVILSADEAEFALEELRQRGKMLGQIVTADKKKVKRAFQSPVALLAWDISAPFTARGQSAIFSTSRASGFGSHSTKERKIANRQDRGSNANTRRRPRRHCLRMLAISGFFTAGCYRP